MKVSCDPACVTTEEDIASTEFAKIFITWLVDWEPPPSLVGPPSLPQDLRHHLLRHSGLVLQRSGFPSHPRHTQSTFSSLYTQTLPHWSRSIAWLSITSRLLMPSTPRTVSQPSSTCLVKQILSERRK